MIDTVHINLHNLAKNYDVYNWIVRDGNNGVIKYQYDQTGRRIRDTGELDGGLLSRQVKVYPEAEKSTEVLRIHTRYEPSSHYSIIVEVHPKRDLIKFAFSVPKYFYGHNIAQAVENTNERDFAFIRGFTDTFDIQIERSYARLVKYIKSFFHSEFAGVDIDWCDVEVTRLDFCYNQFFNSKQEALFYLDMQKKIPKKYARRDNQNITAYRTSIFYHSRDYSVKIYHKGSEYEKNDSKQHERANKAYHKKHGHDLYDIGYLQDVADRILRYEVTFRKDYMSYLFNTRLFRRKSTQFKQFKRVYDAMHSLHQMARIEAENRLLHNTDKKEKMKHVPVEWESIKPIYTEFQNVKITDNNGSETYNICDYIGVYYKKCEASKLTKHMIVSSLNKFYDDFGAMISKPRKFYLKLDQRDQDAFHRDNTSNLNFLKTVEAIPLHKELCVMLGDFLYKFCKDFKVNERDNLGNMIARIHQHNARVEVINKNKKNMLPMAMQSKFKTKKKIDVNRMSFVLVALESHPLHDLRNMLHLDDQAFMRLKKDLSAIGIDGKALNHVQPIPTSLDFGAYFEECLLNSKRMFINNASTRIFSAKDQEYLRFLNAA